MNRAQGGLKTIIALFCLGMLSLSLVVMAGYELFSRRTFSSWQMERHITLLAELGAPAIAASLASGDEDAIDDIARAIADDPDVEKLEIEVPSGLSRLSLPKTVIRSERMLQTVTQPIETKAETGLNEVGRLRLYFATPQTRFVSDPANLTILVALMLIVTGGRMGVGRFRPASASASQRRARLKARKVARQHRGMPTSVAPRHRTPLPSAMQPGGAQPSGAPLDSVTEMAWLMNPAGEIIDVSDGWLKYGGYGRGNVTGKPFSRFLQDADRAVFEERLRRMQRDRMSQNWVLQLLKADGHSADIWFSATLVPLPNGDSATLAVMKDISELIDLETKTSAPAISDYLTGLLNRVGFEKALERLIDNAPDDIRISCLVVDIDRFETVNDHHGHSAGDELLRAFVRRLRSTIESVALAARLGGDEFAFVVADDGDDGLVNTLAERLHACSELNFFINGVTVSTTVSIGIASYPTDATGAEELVRFASIAMSRQKRAGRHGTQFFRQEMLAASRQRAETENDLLRGLENGWFEPYFQPIIHLETRTISGFESLMRLRHPEKGMIMPNVFIPVAEEAQLLDSIGRQFLVKVLQGLGAMSAISSDIEVAVNLSPSQLTPQMVGFIADKLEQYRIEPARLTVEITEAVFLEDTSTIRESLKNLRQLGCRIALDDFGTGYSSLSYLSRFHVDRIKIDQSFTKSLADDDPTVANRSRRLIEGIAAISQSMGCDVVAEGVEELEQLRHVLAIAIGEVQGYLFGRPLPLSETILYLRQQAPSGRISLPGLADLLPPGPDGH